MIDRQFKWSVTIKETKCSFKISTDIFGSITIPIGVAVEKFLSGGSDSGWYVQTPKNLNLDTLKVGGKKSNGRHDSRYFRIMIPAENVKS
jgi:hypothetical protein